jgi:hypothetical protein
VKLKKGGGCCLPIIDSGIILLIIFYIIGSSGNSGGVITDDRTYSESWRLPYGTEYSKIRKIIVQNGIKDCGEYYMKEVETNEICNCVQCRRNNVGLFCCLPKSWENISNE